MQKFQLGRIKEFTSPHVCEVDFVKQTPQVTAALIRDLKSQPKDWQKNYKVQTSTCTRDLRSLALVAAHSQEEALRRGIDVDLFVDQTGPAVQRGDDDDVDGNPVERLGSGPDERVQPEQVRGQPEEVQPQVQELAPSLKPSPRKRAIKERWTLKQ